MNVVSRGGSALRPEHNGELALVMGGGGARAAYQVGLLRALARRHPELRAQILTGVSAGAINAAFLASHPGTFREAVEELAALWSRLTLAQVMRVEGRSLVWNVLRWAVKLVSGGIAGENQARSMVDTEPLRGFLTTHLPNRGGELVGIRENLARGQLKAVALSTSSYTTGQSITWVEGRDVAGWHRPQRQARITRLTIEHVMASSALPLFFPAVRLGDHWYGDGGIRLSAPLSPALHLGADRVLAISTRYDRSEAESEEAEIPGYPPPAQVLGVLLNSIFLDLMDQDAHRVGAMNRLLSRLPAEHREGLRPVQLLTVRPSMDLGRLASDFEETLPPAFRFLTRGLGTRETRSPDMLSFLLFQPGYLRLLLRMGEEDGERQIDTLDELVK